MFIKFSRICLIIPSVFKKTKMLLNIAHRGPYQILQNRMAQVGRDSKVQPPCYRQIHRLRLPDLVLAKAIQGSIQAGLEHL